MLASSSDAIAGQAAIAFWFVAFALAALTLVRHASGWASMIVKQCAMASVAVWTAAGSVLAILGVRSEARGDARLVAVPVCRRRHAWAEAMPMARSRGCSAGPWRRGISVRADGDRQIDVRRYSDELLRRH